MTKSFHSCVYLLWHRAHYSYRFLMHIYACREFRNFLENFRFFFQILLHLNRLKLTGRYRWFSNMCWPFGFFEDRGWLFLLSIFIGIFYYQIFLPSYPHWFLNQIKNAYLIIFFLNIELLVLHCNICNTWRVPLYQPENWRFIFYTSWLKTL